MPFNSDLARRKFFASRESRDQYDKYFYAKGEHINQYSGKDMVGMKKHDMGYIPVPHQRNPDETIPVMANTRTELHKILDNFHDPHSASGSGSGKDSNRKLIITGKNQFFKPRIVNQNEFRDMVSNRMVQNLTLRKMLEENGQDISARKMPERFPYTDAGFTQFRRAMSVGVVPLNPKK
ncbi:MAG: hypothetical protein OPY03_01780 [Nitrosopumilus sp.]|nr:hypothetical protein [Nitrosopumilus sp.]